MRSAARAGVARMGATRTGIEKRRQDGINAQKFLDFASLASWYAENLPKKQPDVEWTVERVYLNKQRELKFLSL